MAGSRLEKVGTIFTRKELMDKLFTNMGYLTSQYDKDLCLMKDNIKKLEVFTSQAIKSSKDTIKTFEWRVTGFKDLFKSFQDRVEGLLRCGGMRIEERPLWWDVYRAFPAAREPDFAKPVPKVPIRNIFYEEDALRAKFHKTGLPLGTVTLSDEKYKSNSQKVIDIYKKMSADSPGAGPALYDKSIAVLEGELSSQKNYQQTRREELEVADEKPTTIAAMFAEGQKSQNTEQTIKNIFKD